MSSPAVLARGRLAEEVLASPQPRCLWDFASVRPNAAFKAEFPEFPLAELAAPARQAQERAQTESARICDRTFVFVPLVIADIDVVLIEALNGCVEQRIPDRLSFLPDLISLVNMRDLEIGDVRAFIDLLLRTQRGTFTGALLFQSREFQPFVCVYERGRPAGTSRAWLRWPFERLYSTGRPGVIHLPGGREQALVVPFNPWGENRYVVVVTLAHAAQQDPETALVLRTFSALTIQKPESAQVIAPAAPAAPRIVWYGSPSPFQRRVGEMLLRRGWQPELAQTLGQLWHAIDSGRVDIICIEVTTKAVREDLQSVRHLSGALNVAVILFENERDPDPELDLLVERRLSTSACSTETFRAIKDAIRSIPLRRRHSMRATIGRFWLPMLESRDCTRLARLVARAAGEAGADWSSVHLFDRAGNAYCAQWPFDEKIPIESVPSTFLSGYPTLSSSVDERFFDEVIDDAGARLALLRMSPLSGASIPLTDGGLIVGTLLAFSTQSRMAEVEFEALTGLAEMASRAFNRVQTRMERSHVSAFSHDAYWSGLTGKAGRIDTYCGPRAESRIRALTLADGAIAIVAAAASNPVASLEIAEWVLGELDSLAGCEDELHSDLLDAIVEGLRPRVRRLLVGIVSPADQNFTYSAVAYPAPVHVVAAGPALPFQHNDGRRSGCIPIKPRSATLLFDDAPQPIDSARVVELIQARIAQGSDNPLRAVVNALVDSASVAMAAITMPNFGAER